MKKNFLFILITIASFSVYGQTGKMFPALTGEILNNKKITIPVDIKGKYTLIGMAYSQKAEKELGTWLMPVYETFIAKPEKNDLFKSYYNVHLYFIPMFTGVNQTAAGTAKKKLIKEVDQELLDHVIVYSGELKKYKDELDFAKRDTPYFFVLDKQGKIVYATSGEYSDEKMSEIEEILETEQVKNY